MTTAIGLIANQTSDYSNMTNRNSVFTTLGASSHTPEQRALNDFYATQPKAIDKLICGYSNIPRHIWECACGHGHLSERLIYFGYDVTSTDLMDRGYGQGEVDFFRCAKLPKDDITCILTNPPYKHAMNFVLHALELLPEGGQCIMFLKTTFLEGKERYRSLFKVHPPKYVLQFSERIMCAKNAQFERMKRGGGSAVAYAWYVWEKGFQGDTIIRWI